jgi:hypothetical protein
MAGGRCPALPTCAHLAGWGKRGSRSELEGVRKDKLRQALATCEASFLACRYAREAPAWKAQMTQPAPGTRRAAHPVPGPPACDACQWMEEVSSDESVIGERDRCQRLPPNPYPTPEALPCAPLISNSYAFFSGEIPLPSPHRGGTEVPLTPQCTVSAPCGDSSMSCPQPAWIYASDVIATILTLCSGRHKLASPARCLLRTDSPTTLLCIISIPEREAGSF